MRSVEFLRKSGEYRPILKRNIQAPTKVAGLMYSESHSQRRRKAIWSVTGRPNKKTVRMFRCKFAISLWCNLTQSAHVTVINGSRFPAMKTAHFIGFRLSTCTPPPPNATISLGLNMERDRYPKHSLPLCNTRLCTKSRNKAIWSVIEHLKPTVRDRKNIS